MSEFSKQALADYLKNRIDNIQIKRDFDTENGTKQLEGSHIDECVDYGILEMCNKIIEDFELPAPKIKELIIDAKIKQTDNTYTSGINDHKHLIGKYVNIYKDPMAKTELEGTSNVRSITRVIPLNFKKKLIHADVEFIGDEKVYPRSFVI
jgi:hypothetical protein